MADRAVAMVTCDHVTQGQRRVHAARVAGRHAARARRRRVPAAGRRAARQLAAGCRAGDTLQEPPERAGHVGRGRRGRADGRVVGAVHARVRGPRRRRTSAGCNAASALQRRCRSHCARLGLVRRRGGVARLVRRVGERAGGGGRRAPRARRRRRRRASVRHALADAGVDALV